MPTQTLQANEKSVFSVIAQTIKTNLRSFAMIAALVAIWIFFTALTDGTFLEARNLSNLFRQMAVIGVLAVGMVFIIVSGNIDLSIGSVVGVTGAVAALIQVKWLGPWLFNHFPNAEMATMSLILTCAAVLSAVLLGALIGLFQGFWVAYAGVPAFIVTLAGMLMFRGMILGLTGGMTVAPMEPEFRSIGQAYVTLGLGWGVAIFLALGGLFALFRNRSKAKSYGLPVSSFISFASLALGMVASIFLFTSVMNDYRGIPVPVILLFALAGMMTFLAKNTPFGRYIWAIGGNREAARLSGIGISKVLLWNFIIMGVLSGVGGIVLTARLDAATVNAGNLFELNAIAACVIGGCSLAGGSGAIAGAIVGALVMASLDNGMSLMNVEVFWQQIVKGLVLLLAVWVDIYSRKSKGV